MVQNSENDNFYEVVVPEMMPKLFRRFFRMYDETLKSIICYLGVNEPHATLLDKGKVPKEKKVAMTCYQPVSTFFY